MEANHVLLQLASTYRRFCGDLSPEDCQYDPLVGAWILESSGELLVETGLRRGPRSKKEDVETGEDHKSE
jgi:hypothetical protein